MTTATLTAPDAPQMAYHMERMARQNGRAFITPPLSATVRAEGLELARAAGLGDFAAQLTDAQICTLYASTRSNSSTGINAAERLSKEIGAPNPIFGDVPPTAPPTAPTDDRGAPMPAPADMETILTVAREAGRDAASSEVQAQLSDIDDTIEKAARRAVEALQPTSLIVTLPESAPVALGTVHYAQARIIRMLAAGVNLYLHGPAGSGKTTAARKAATAFKLPFYFAAKVESEYMLLGFKDARGEVVRTPFREAYEHGGLFLFDEIDGSASSAVVAINAALANGICPFPDGTIERHKDFKCIAAGNTTLGGADRQYTGRTQLDAASIDRFAFLEFGYDEPLELALSTNKQWAEYVQAVRAAIKARGLMHLVTPRATIDGGKLLAGGDTWQEAASAVIFKGLDADTVAQIKRACSDLEGGN